MTFAVKNEEWPKLIRFKEGRTLKRFLRGPEREEHHQAPATFNITQTRFNLLTVAFDGSHVTRESPPHLHFTSSAPAFSFPVDINFGWPRNPLTYPYQHKYWNIFIARFYYHTTHVKIPKINSFLSRQSPNILSSLFHSNSHIHRYNCLKVLFFFFVFLIQLEP